MYQVRIIQDHMRRFITLLTLLLTVSVSLVYTDYLKNESTNKVLQSENYLKPITANPEFASVIGVKIYPVEKVHFYN